jgi:hypothetical protein
MKQTDLSAWINELLAVTEEAQRCADNHDIVLLGACLKQRRKLISAITIMADVDPHDQKLVHGLMIVLQKDIQIGAALRLQGEQLQGQLRKVRRARKLMRGFGSRQPLPAKLINRHV